MTAVALCMSAPATNPKAPPSNGDCVMLLMMERNPPPLNRRRFSPTSRRPRKNKPEAEDQRVERRHRKEVSREGSSGNGKVPVNEPHFGTILVGAQKSGRTVREQVIRSLAIERQIEHIDMIAIVALHKVHVKM